MQEMNFYGQNDSERRVLPNDNMQMPNASMASIQSIGDDLDISPVAPVAKKTPTKSPAGAKGKAKKK